MSLVNYLNLFPPSSREKPRFMALAAAVLQQAAELQALIPSLESGFSFASAAGVQLDALGASVSIPRPSGWSDETYRDYLLQKLKTFSWNGLNDTVDSVLPSGTILTDNCNGTVTCIDLSFLPSLLSPLTCDDIRCLLVLHKVHWNCCELLASTTLKEKYLVVIRDVHKSSDISLCLFDNLIKNL